MERIVVVGPVSTQGGKTYYGVALVDITEEKPEVIIYFDLFFVDRKEAQPFAQAMAATYGVVFFSSADLKGGDYSG